MDPLIGTSYCCGWPTVKLVATIWAIATCAIFLIYFILIFDYHRVMFGSTLPSVESQFSWWIDKILLNYVFWCRTREHNTVL